MIIQCNLIYPSLCHIQYIFIDKMQVVSTQTVQKAIENLLQNQTCLDFHPGMTCNQKAWSQFLLGSKSIYKMYLIVHLIPFLLFKRNPVKEISNVALAFVKSLLFAGGYSALVRRIVCLVTQSHKFVGYSNSIAAIFASVTLSFQPVSRQSQIALYCLNKTMQVCYNMARRRGWPVKLPKGECLILGIALALITYNYIEHPDAIRGSYKKALDKLLGNI